MIKVLIVEDESHTAQLLKDLIEIDGDFKVVCHLESIQETVHYLSRNEAEVDLIFLDIQLADGYSFEIFKHIDINKPIIFCTAYEQYTYEAIKNNGIDYIVKPFEESEVFESLSKYKQRILATSEEVYIKLNNLELPTLQQYFITQFRDKSMVIPFQDIMLFSIEYEQVYMYTQEGNKYPVFKKLDYIESVCDSQLFYRINRQMIVNKNYIVSIESLSNRKIKLTLKISLENPPVVSRLKVSDFKKWLSIG